MHEKSLVRSLLKQIEQIRVDNDAVCVDVVAVELGPLSGVEAELIASAFDEFVGEYFDPPPGLDIRIVPLRLCCQSCLRESAVDGLSLQCPECASTDVRVIRGDEFRLLDVSLQVPI